MAHGLDDSSIHQTSSVRQRCFTLSPVALGLISVLGDVLRTKH